MCFYLLPGHFLCPVNGVYLALITGRAIDGNYMNVQIVKNREVCGSIIEYDSRLPWNTVSNGCLMECSEGESIYIEGLPLGLNGGSVYGDPSVPYSTFSVLLMNQLGEAFLDFILIFCLFVCIISTLKCL